MLRGLIALLWLLTQQLHAANTFFVTYPVQAPAGALGQDALAAASAGLTALRHQIPGELAHQKEGPDGPGVGRIYTKAGIGSYVMADVGSQWVSGLSQGQTLLAINETFAGQYGWTGKPFVGASSAAIDKSDLVTGRMALAPVLMSEIPAPALVEADLDKIVLNLPPFVDASGLAVGLVLWRQNNGGEWSKLADLPQTAAAQTLTDSAVSALGLYRYGLSVRYPWPGGGQAGALGAESGSYVTLARSDSGLLQASKEQPTPTPFPTIPVQIPTPDLGSEAWLAYPNPSREGKFRLAFRMVKKGSYYFKAFSLDGALVHRFEGKGEAGTWPMPTADLSRMASGIYLFQLTLRYDGESSEAQPIRKVAIVR